MRSVLICVALLIFSGASTAQSGLIFEDLAYEQIPALSIQSKDEVQRPLQISLKRYAPLAESQGNMASCVGWAVGYGAMTIQQAIREGITDRAYITDQLAYSPSYIYNQIKKGTDCDSGASLNDALKLLIEQGDCSRTIFPSSRSNCTQLPTLTAKQEAARYRIKTGRYRVFAIADVASTKIENVKQQLAQKNPVVVGFDVTPAYAPFMGKSLWNGEGKTAGHAMVVVGYDDEKKAFELMNSFGPSWGKGGFIWMPYTHFGQHARQAIVLTNTATSKGKADAIQNDSIAVQLTGRVALKKVVRQDQTMQEIAFQLDTTTQRYGLEQPILRSDRGLYQVSIDVPRGRCAYVFNMDTRHKVQALGKLEYAPQDTTLTFPHQGYYQFSSAGIEQIVVIFSSEILQTADDNFEELQTKTEFGQPFISPEYIHLNRNLPKFKSAVPNTKGTAVSLRLELEIK